MKATYAMLALAAGLGEVNAHWGKNAKKYSTPGNSNNYCDTDMKNGWTWDGLSTGSFDSYNGWDFSGGWSCKSSNKRSLDGRTFGKAISSSCGSDVSSAPSFSCGSSSDVSSFSISTFQISVEFDCRMEFHYEMEDGSSCKESHQCSSGSYNTITNTQCGGAKKVSFVYPEQDNDKDNCEIEIPSVDFDCETSTITGSVPDVTTTAGQCTKPGCEGYETTTAECTKPGCQGYETTTPGSGNECTTPGCEGYETTTPGSGDHTYPGGENTKTVPSGEQPTTTGENSGETTTYPGGENTKTVPSGEQPTTTPGSGDHTYPGGENTKTVPSGEQPTTTGENSGETTSPATYVTTYDSTSTVYITTVHTITSCAPTVTNCPAESHSVIVVTETVAIDTTVCPVTETVTGPAETQPGKETTVPEGTTTAPNSGVTHSVPSGEESNTESVPAGETTAYTAPNSGVTHSVPSGEKSSTESVPAGETTAYTVPSSGETTTAPSSGETTSAPESGEETTIVTSYDSTSTIYTTSVKTVTSCGAEVTNCPANSGTAVVVTETVAISTTVCPVTETRVEKPTKSSPSGTEGGNSPSETTGESSGATQTSDYDVPDVVPSCLNTFLDYVEDCEDNTDSSCYCPNQDFVNKVFQCLYAHGESDDVVAKAVSFFQGICAGYVSENPAVGTGAESVTSIITVTGTTVIASAHYTTVTVDTTVTQPCTTGGSTVSGSSTVVTISTEYTVPEVGFTTGSSGSVGVVAPVTTGSAAATAPYQTATLVTSAPAGTGGYAVPTTTAAGEVPVTGGAARAGMGFAAAILAAALAL